MDVREVTPGDAEAMAQVMAAVAEEGTIATEAPVDVPARAAKFRGEIEAGGLGTHLVLCDGNGRVVGIGALHETPIAGVLSLGISLLPQARGQGGGRRLLDALMAAGEAGDAHKIELECWTDNAVAIALYARSGFHVEGVRRNHYRRRDGSLRSTILMARMMDAPGTHPDS